jgi:hypothetical protein
VGIHQETPLNTDLRINNKRHDRKIGTVLGGTCKRVNGGDEGEEIWLMGFIYTHAIEQ